jgi:hypothetical protein
MEDIQTKCAYLSFEIASLPIFCWETWAGRSCLHTKRISVWALRCPKRPPSSPMWKENAKVDPVWGRSQDKDSKGHCHLPELSSLVPTCNRLRNPKRTCLCTCPLLQGHSARPPAQDHVLQSAQGHQSHKHQEAVSEFLRLDAYPIPQMKSNSLPIQKKKKPILSYALNNLCGSLHIC